MDVKPLPNVATTGASMQRPAAEQSSVAPGASPKIQQPPVSALVPQSEKPSREQVEEAVKTANDFVSPINSAIQFTLDDESGNMVVKVIDSATKEVIRQFPSDEMLSIARALDRIKGLLVEQKA